MKSYVGPDGRWHHRFRQSWLGTTDRCPELGRRTHHGDGIADRETDAACVGTAVHHAIQVCIESGGLDVDSCVALFTDEFARLQEHPNFEWVKYKPASAAKFGRQCVNAWHEEVLPTLDLGTAITEREFVVPLMADDERVIELSGTIDYLEGSRILDWKTSGRGEYAEWEKRRWDVQSAVYTYAVWHQDLWRDPATIPEFQFVVLGGHGTQRFTVHRGPEHWAWLEAKSLSYAKLIEADLDLWPLSDSTALCSPKWCDAWSSCKGAFLGDNPW